MLHLGKDGKFRTVAESIEDIQQFLHICHTANSTGGHSGINNTRTKLKLKYTWLGISEDVYEYIETCEKCQVHNAVKTSAPTMIPIKPSGPFHLVGMDLVGPLQVTNNGNKYIITFTDYFTKWVEVMPIKNKTAESVAAKVRSFVNRHGPPHRILSDQGREFCNSINKALFDSLGIKHSVTSAYHPQTNGLDERTNQTVKRRLAKYINLEQTDWDEHLDHVAFSININKQKTTKFSPFFLLYGRDPYHIERLKIEPAATSDIKEDQNDEEIEEYVQERAQQDLKTKETVMKNIEEAKRGIQAEKVKRR